MEDLSASRRIVLLRHAKAEHGGDLADHLRPLSLVGRRQATGVGATLRTAGVIPELVLCSSSLRTRQTWDLVRSSLGTQPTVELSDTLYSAGVRALLDVVRAVPADVRTVLVVGHEPTVSEAAATLAGPGSDEPCVARVRVGMPTGSYSVLETDVDWALLEPDGARLLRLVTPA
ncbi:phosphohistidine phosphatase (plasmid) [Cellulomonas sp. WB94]|uniref:SixA phosphatase family protein n=1 Tax=Cellulomonas sp. WB94 TaxID=2173174 RepID=UPI000D57F81A|nr:histidine phosphatase family protein [Cellulomonas sp. WB94]PVU81249.1 phosphohistidine phosphatase [Cellulomonas sp. WB94]